MRILGRFLLHKHALLLLLLVGLAPLEARAQFSAPKSSDEVEAEQSVHPGKKKKHKPKPEEDPGEEGLPTDTGPDEPEEPPPEEPVRSKVRDAGPAEAPDAGPKKGAAADAGVPPGEADAGVAAVAPLELPRSSVATLLTTWETRRKAVADRNTKVARDAEAELLRQRDELGIGSLDTIAGALDAEAHKRLAGKDGAEAIRLAELAVAVAPDSPAARLELARVHFANSPGAVAEVLGAVQGAAVRSLEEPAYRRALLGNLLAALLLGLGLASVLGLLALASKSLRYAAHDFHHLLPRGSLPAQTALLFVLVLAAPLAFHLGWYAELVGLGAAVFLYLSVGERVALSGMLLALGALPTLAGLAARETVYEGSLAAEVARVQEGGPDAQAALAHLAELEAKGKADFPVTFVLALDAKRQGDYLRAVELYRKAVTLNPQSGEAANNLGNALFLKGEKENARDAYLKATELGPDQAVFHYNLYKASARWALLGAGTPSVGDDIERGRTAQAAVLRLDRSLMDLPADRRANHVVLDAHLPKSALAGLVDARPFSSAVSQQLRYPLLGALQEELALAVAAAAVLGLWALALLQRRLRPSTECSKCGRPVCVRCDKEVAGGTICGQCFNVFARKGAVDPPTRVRKEAEVKRYQERWGLLRRLASYLCAGAGHLLSGRPGLGAAFLLSSAVLAAVAGVGDGLFRTPFGRGLGMLPQALALVLLIGVWLLSIRSYRAAEGRR